jgi:hypothetical protein
MPGATEEDLLRRETEQILSSNTFRSCGSLRKLLEFLVNCAIAGDTRDLKEYRIGVEGLGKPPSYDPRVDPSVRVQVGRLRSRLSEYYLHEGQHDAVVIQIPKGGFSVEFEQRRAPDPSQSKATSPADAAPAAAPAAAPRPNPFWRLLALTLGLICAVLALILFSGWSARPAASPRSPQTADFKELWRPYLAVDTPVLISLGVPLGIRFQAATPDGESLIGHFRDGRLNEWPTGPDSAEGKRLRLWQQQLGTARLEASYQYMAVGEAIGAILLGSALGTQNDFTIVRSNMLSWDAAKGANVVFIGAPKFNPHLRNVPFSRNFRIGDFHVHNLHPGAGEKSAYPDVESSTDRQGAALVGRYRSPGGGSWFTLIGSANSMCTWAAIEYLTRPQYVTRLTRSFREAYGKVPDSFELVVEASFDQSSPVDVRHVAMRELKN